MCPDVLELLAQRDSCPVIVEAFDDFTDGHGARELLPGGALADRYEFPFVYVRFRRENYTYADLIVWGDMLADVIGEGRDVYAFFRQSAEAAGYATALGELLAEAKSATFSAPPPVVSYAPPGFTPQPLRQAIP
jgi:predicted GNAT superfamily acetyltransferase